MTYHIRKQQERITEIRETLQDIGATKVMIVSGNQDRLKITMTLRGGAWVITECHESIYLWNETMRKRFPSLNLAFWKGSVLNALYCWFVEKPVVNSRLPKELYDYYEQSYPYLEVEICKGHQEIEYRCTLSDPWGPGESERVVEYHSILQDVLQKDTCLKGFRHSMSVPRFALAVKNVGKQFNLNMKERVRL